MEQNTVRKDYLLDRLVVMAAGRAKRPSDLRMAPMKLPQHDKKCPFCPGNENNAPPELGRRGTGKKWSVRAFGNKYAAFAPCYTNPIHAPNGLEEWPATGFHEIVVETPKHNQTLWDLPQKQWLELFSLIAERQEEMLFHTAKHAFVIKNWGPECGASLAHSHWQILGLPQEARRVEKERKAAEEFFKSHHKNAFDWIVQLEQKSARRWLSNKEWIAFCPFASIWPYEFWVMPKKQVSSFRKLTRSQQQALASILFKAFSRFKQLFGNPPYNLVFHETMQPSKQYRFHIEVYPDIHKVWGGIEKGSGIYINEVPPELAAKTLRRG